MAKYTCPYCFNDHTFSEIEFRCVNSFCTADEQDEQYAKYLGLKKEDMPRTKATFPSTAKILAPFKNMFMPVWENCPHCEMKSSVRVCPDCHNELPEGIQDNEDMIIAIVGSRDTGKTHFISVLIDELQKRICPSVLNGTFNPTSDAVLNHYQENFYNKVFQDGVLHKMTETGHKAGESTVRKPLVYEMMIPLDSKGRKIRKFTFVFYDTAGEDLKNEAAMRMVNRYICKASGIIFLLDPMQVPELRLNMNDDEINSSSSIGENELEAQEIVLRRISNLIREDKAISKKKRIDIPTAIVFSKFDVLQRFFPKGSIVLEPSSYLREGNLDKTEWFTVSSEIEAMLKNWGAVNFASNVDMNFSKYTYCTVSALGQQPVYSESKKLKELQTKPKPHRVEDPFLWILKENRIIKEQL